MVVSFLRFVGMPRWNGEGPCAALERNDLQAQNPPDIAPGPGPGQNILHVSYGTSRKMAA